jgi:ABC-type transport system involved in multi-copper enzyme maturation permease subunit
MNAVLLNSPWTRLLSAELRKLSRPLTWSLAVFAVTFCLLLTAGAANNAHLGMNTADLQVHSCAELAQADGQQLSADQCAAAQSAEAERGRIRAAEGARAAATVADQLSPAASGAEAAGLLASMPGALLVALLAGGHVGGEWSGRTLKNLLAQHGKRGEVVAAKLVSLWAAIVGIGFLCWAALAASGSVLAKVNGLPPAKQSVSSGLAQSGTEGARALLVLAFFAAIGLLAALVTRGTVGTITATVGATVALLAVGTLPAVGRWTPATWVEAWMGFTSGDRSISTLPDNFWSRFTTAGVVPGHAFGLIGLLGSLAALVVASWRLFGRTDVA